MSDCLDIENNIKNINKIKETIKVFNSKGDIIEFIPDNEREINEFLNEIKINLNLNLSQAGII